MQTPRETLLDLGFEEEEGEMVLKATGAERIRIIEALDKYQRASQKAARNATLSAAGQRSNQ